MRSVASKISTSTLPRNFDDLVRSHPPQAIHDQIEYENAQQMIDALTSIPKLTKDQARYLETLSILFSEYERKVHAIDVSDLGPLEMLKHLLTESGMNASDLGRLLGERSLGPKIINGGRELSKAHIRALAEHFSVSPALFL